MESCFYCQDVSKYLTDYKTDDTCDKQIIKTGKGIVKEHYFYEAFG